MTNFIFADTAGIRDSYKLYQNIGRLLKVYDFDSLIEFAPLVTEKISNINGTHNKIKYLSVALSNAYKANHIFAAIPQKKEEVNE